METVKQVKQSDARHHYSILPNGLLVATEMMPDIESASINIGVKSGSRHEPAQLNGIAHFLEHMAFKGTSKRSAKQIAEEFDAIGGYFNAYTSREHTTYSAKVLKGDIGQALDILADVIQNSSFEQIEIEKEFNVILQEIAQNNDAPDSIIFDYFQQRAFPDQAIGRPILGTIDTISKFTPEIFRNYVQDHYHASNIILSVVGNIDHSLVHDLAHKLFTISPMKKNIEMQKANYAGGLSSVYRDLEQAQVLIGFANVTYNDPQYYIAQITSIILGGSMSSRLFQEVREKRGLAYSVGSFGSYYIDNGIFSLYAATDANNIMQLCDVMINEFANLAHTINDEELERAKTQARASILMSLESSGQRAEDIVHNYSIYGRRKTTEEVIKNIEDITKSEISKFVRFILSSSKPTLAIMGKINEDTDYYQVVDKYQ